MFGRKVFETLARFKGPIKERLFTPKNFASALSQVNPYDPRSPVHKLMESRHKEEETTVESSLFQSFKY
jgi:hypothetical protein